MLSRLHTLLREVRNEAGDSFSGIGLLVSSVPDDLPTIPLRQTHFLPDRRSTLDRLVEISDQTSEFHDGFHILSPELDLERVSLYFSPPIVAGLGTDPIRRVGGRYMAALFGSTLTGIIATGVASPRYGVAVFHRGKEISVEP